MIPLPNIPKVAVKKGNAAFIEIEPFYPGYGITVGNSFRRVLYSSLKGAAITEVKIKGINNEFMSLPGLMEDALIVLLNLKKIRFKNWTEEPQKIELSVKGERKVTANDFKKNPAVFIANPETYIAALTDKKAELQIEAKVEKGIGYSIVEDRDIKVREAGVIPIDAAFTPVKKVNFKIENVRVGKMTDFEKLIFEIETDGTITPEEAFNQAAKILFDHFSLFAKFGEEEQAFVKAAPGKKKPEGKEQKESGKKEKNEPEEIKKVKTEDLKVSERTKNALLNNGLKTVGGIARKSEKDLLKMEGMGEVAIKEIKKALKKYNLGLKE